MKSRASLKRAVAAVAVGVLIGGGVTTITPAGAEVSQFAATNWKKIWKKKLQPQADKRYYTKAASDAKYAAAGSAYSKAEVEAKLGGYYTKAQADAALGGYYTKAQADAKYQPVGSYAAAGSSYTKAEGDAKYAPYPSLIRGRYAMEDSAGPIQLDSPISFGTTLSAVPTSHFIAAGAAVPVGCSGTAIAPNAAPGHLCIFEELTSNVASRSVFLQSTFGAVAYITPTTAGSGVWSLGSWAVRPLGLAAPTSVKAPGGTNGLPSATGGTRSGEDAH